MEKLVVSPHEVASVSVAPAEPAAAPQLLPAMPRLGRVALAPLVLILPLLCLATIAVWIAVQRKEARVRHAWLQYCCGLLVASGLASSVTAGLAYFLGASPVVLPPAPLTLEIAPELPQTLPAESLSPRELASRVEKAVFIVSRENKWFRPTREALGFTGFGTAVLLFGGKDEYLFATARHVLDGEKWQRSKPYGGAATLWDRANGAARAEIAGRHQSLDLLLLRMPRPAGEATFAQAVLPFGEIAPGERIMVFGHPEGLFFSLSDGLVSRKDPAGTIQITAPVSPGASGGPVYDLRGRLLGIVSSMLDKRLSPHSENLNFAVRADSIFQPEKWQLDPKGAALLKEYIAAFASSTPPTPTP